MSKAAGVGIHLCSAKYSKMTATIYQLAAICSGDKAIREGHLVGIG